MTPNFDALYEAAADSRAAIQDAINDLGIQTTSNNRWCLLEVGDFVNYRVYLSVLEPGGKYISFTAAPYEAIGSRDCTVEEIRECTAKTIAALRKLTRKGRIAELEEELAKLKAEEE